MRSNVGKAAAWKALLTGVVGVVLLACQPPALLRLPATSASGPAVGAAYVPAVDTSLSGRVEFPATRQTQASVAEAVASATLALYEPSANLTVVVGKTDDAGRFSLNVGGYTPKTDATYLLEASKGLDHNAAGSDTTRMRTYLKWTGSSWQSITTGSVLINTVTTALALTSSLDPTHVPPSTLIGTVNGTTLLSAPAGHPAEEVTQLAAAIASYLAGNVDPVAGVSDFTPTLTGVSPAMATYGAAVALDGSGFSPLPGDNVVSFGTATASVYMATPRRLIAIVPPWAASGPLTVTTRSKVSNALSFTVGPSSLGGFWISNIQPIAVRPGESITITGGGFSPVAADNVVSFSGTATLTAPASYSDGNTLIATVPANAVSGPVAVLVGSNASNRYYLNVLAPGILGIAPAAAAQNSDVTLTGNQFGGYGAASWVKFNGTPASSIVSWNDKQIVAKVPGPSLTARISGPVSMNPALGAGSPPSLMTFTALASRSEDFTGAPGAGNGAAWGGGALQVSGPNPAFLQSDFTINTNTAGLAATAGGLTLNTFSTRKVTGFVPAYSPTYGQLGVDNDYFYLNKGDSTNQLSVSRYSLATGAFVDSAAPGNNARALIWDRRNNRYLAGDYNGYRLFTFGSWGNFTPLSGPVAQSNAVTYMAANGAAYATHNLIFSHVEQCYDDWYSEWYDCSYYNYGPYAWTPTLGAAAPLVPTDSSFGWTTGAAGFAGMDEYLLTPVPSLNAITALDRVKNGQQTTNAVALPFSISGPGYSNGSYANYGPTIGSDGAYLYVLGKNAGYNAGAVTLFKFIYNSSANAATLAPVASSGVSVTPVINLPANALWESVTFDRTVPAGSTCTIDVLDSAGNVLFSNISSGQSLVGLPTNGVKLRATLTSTTAIPFLSSWAVNVRRLNAVSPAYDTGTNFPAYQTPVFTCNGFANRDYSVSYSDSADGVNWGPDVADISLLTRRYVRFKVVFKTLDKQITRVVIPYAY